MNWVNKAHKRIEKQKSDEKYSKDLRNALDLFFLIQCVKSAITMIDVIIQWLPIMPELQSKHWKSSCQRKQ
ncbi:hypothetical protein EAI93_06315 [[Ruminococcus] torques]|uniref:Uncharacterized protein n=1 Tax=[Ruminococcus] torques TaxID=33039 RepID=A0A4Q5C790_9FIRM|nr:hypothetical protein EAI93_06315 [[Ruminococcus] torques]